MSAPIDDGGPAYPTLNSHHNPYDDGMTKREVFAKAILAGMAANPKLLSDNGEFHQNNFQTCCDMADALLAALKGGPQS